MVRHDDGDLTLGGWFNGTMFLPGTTLGEADGRGFLVRAVDGLLGGPNDLVLLMLLLE